MLVSDLEKVKVLVCINVRKNTGKHIVFSKNTNSSE